MIVGKVINSVGPQLYKVKFINGQEEICKSCKLKVVPDNEIPPSLRPVSDASDTPHDSTSPSSRFNANDDDESYTSINEGNEESVENSNKSSQENTDLNIQELFPQNDNHQTQEEPSTYHKRLQAARNRVRNLTGDTTTTQSGTSTIVWTVIE